MSKKKMYFLTLDTETATLPFSDELCDNSDDKRKIAIAKPLVYDIGWTISDRKGNILKKENFLVQETFFVPSVFNTAYYKDKRPYYLTMMKDGKIKTANWENIMTILYNDIINHNISAVTAYNAAFDFKKAIPFTNQYIKNLYSVNYNDWEAEQRKKCQKILNGEKSDNPDYLIPVFRIFEHEVPIIDLWSVACSKLINHNKYRDFCLKNELWSASIQYFSTSAENVYRYLTKDKDFIESHTALDDAIIETEILTKALKKSKLEPKIEAFPFKNLGTTADYVKIKGKDEFIVKIAEAFEQYITQNDGYNKKGGYWSKVCKIYEELLEIA